MESKLAELVDRLKSAAGDNLTAVVLYGSAVTGEFQEKHSDLNALCVVKQAGQADLEQLHPVAEWWMRQGNAAPLVFTMEELTRSADVFAIEMLDMKRHHRMLFGEDFLEQLEVPMRLHRAQVEHDLRVNWLRLRQAILAAPQKKKAHLGIMVASLSIFCALFKHALIALGQPVPHGKRAAVEGIAALTSADPSAFHALLEFREGKRKERQIDIEATLHSYLEFVELATSEVDRRLDTL
jgi:predicted nucleotidyltransferase